MDRRRFNRLCSTMLAGASSLSLTQIADSADKSGSSDLEGAAADLHATSIPDADPNHIHGAFPRTLLTDTRGQPMTVDNLEIGSSHIFSYPFVTTPCFLLRLHPADAHSASTRSDNDLTTLRDNNGVSYQWHGGVGQDRSIVAFSAICTHKMSHPAKPVSHLNFRPEKKTFFDSNGKKTEQSQLIYCCSEHSVYNPAEGARVLSGPASQPLAAISLELNADNQILAVGSYGGNMYDVFLEKFGFRQAMEQGVSEPATISGSSATATPADEYSQLQILC